MSNKFTSLLALGAGFAIALAAGGTAQAAQFTYDFNATADSGPFTGAMATGFFSFNDDEPPAHTDSFSNFYPVSQAEVNYAGATYTLADADFLVEAATSSADGKLLGLDYTSTALPFSFALKSIDGSKGSFSYAVEGQGGEGSFGYSLRKEQPTEYQPTEEQPTEYQPIEEQPVEEQPIEEQPIKSVPEPSVLIGLGLMSAALLMKKNLRVKAPQFSA